MEAVLASSEAVPFSKTGGLADVASALAKAMSQAGASTHLVTPFYPRQWNAARSHSHDPEIEPTGIELHIPVGPRTMPARLLKSSLPNCDATVWLIDQPQYFDRTGLYGDHHGDFRDNCERFVFFSRGVFEVCQAVGLRPDIVHAHDWQTGLIPALLAAEYRHQERFQQTASIYTIHNLAFQGRFWHWDMQLTGLDWKYFNWRQMEYFGDLNLMKTGIAFADMVTTVSPSYAREIQTAEFGCGLETALRSRQSDLVGILNGIDTDDWNPATDPRIIARYDAATAATGKPSCKAYVQTRFGLPQDPRIPLATIVSRMTGQKGFQLLAGCHHDFLNLPMQFVLLGSGEPDYEHLWRDTAAARPHQVATVIGYDESLAHQLVAGADLFLMPSLYEPCGLTQMYSLRYGTAPVVRAVGGLADSVVDANEATWADDTANGFSFTSFTANGLLDSVRRALEAYHQRDRWSQLTRRGMSQDWSWDRSAREYMSIYRRASERLAQSTRSTEPGRMAMAGS